MPLDQVPVSDQQSIRATIPASSLAKAQQIVGRIRGGYQACQSALAASRAYQRNLTRYQGRLEAYKDRFGTAKAVVVKGKVIHTPPKPPTGKAPTVPADCPSPAVSAGGTP